MKEKRPTISPNFNFLGQLLDFEKRIKSPRGDQAFGEVQAVREDAGSGPCPGPSPAAPPPEASPEEGLLERALGGLHFPDSSEESARLKRSFSLDIQSFGDAASSHRAFGGAGDSGDAFRPAGFKETAGSKACQFSPVEEVSEQSTPERSPDKDDAVGTSIQLAPSNAPKAPPPAPKCWQPLQRSGSLEESAATFLFGLSRSQQHLSKPGPGLGPALKGWHSDILLATSWYLSDQAHLVSTSFLSGGAAAHVCLPGAEAAVRRRRGPRAGDGGASRRSWHEESSFEKQLKRRSCQMELGDGCKDGRPREDVGRAASHSSLELIQVS